MHTQISLFLSLFLSAFLVFQKFEKRRRKLTKIFPQKSKLIPKLLIILLPYKSQKYNCIHYRKNHKENRRNLFKSIILWYMLWLDFKLYLLNEAGKKYTKKSLTKKKIVYFFYYFSAFIIAWNFFHEINFTNNFRLLSNFDEITTMFK